MKMKVLIVSGFLGAGKTTFIKELIRRTDARPVILENEYGDNSIDAQDLRTAEPGQKQPEILEFMEGCVCCTMKDSFVNSVLTVFSGLSPEHLIVEPTGVGRLSSIIANLKPILHDEITLLRPVVVLAPRSLRHNLNEWGELYRDQVANAGTIVFSKGENEAPELLEAAEAAVRDLNPGAEIIRDHYSRQEESWWRSLLDLPEDREDLPEAEGELPEFTQLTLNHARLENPAQLVLLLEDCLRGELGIIARAKGTVPVGGETLRFDLADGLYCVTGGPQGENQCVFIGRDLDAGELRRRMGTSAKAERVSKKGSGEEAGSAAFFLGR